MTFMKPFGACVVDGVPGRAFVGVSGCSSSSALARSISRMRALRICNGRIVKIKNDQDQHKATANRGASSRARGDADKRTHSSEDLIWSENE